MHARTYTKADEEETLALFRTSFNKQITREYWGWLEENPMGGIIRTVMEDAGKIIGYYSVIPLKINANGGQVCGALSVGTMTHPDYRGKGVFTILAKETYAHSKQKGVEFICGFPNANSYPGFTKNLGWFDVCQMPLLELKVKGAKETTGFANISVSTVSVFPEGIDCISSRHSCEGAIMNDRSRVYLNWRYKELPMWEGESKRRYEKYVAIDADGSLLGYMILKLYCGKGERKAHIVDIFTLPKRHDAFKCLASEANAFAKKNGADSISCWMLEHTGYYAELIGMDYKESQEKKQVFGGCLNSDKLKKEFIGNKNKWFITMGDSDVF